MIVVFLVALLAASCGEERPSDAPNVGADHEAVSTAHAEVSNVLSRFADAVHREDLDAILGFFSADYDSKEATGKAAVREWWTRLIQTRLIASLPLDLGTADLTVNDNIAEIVYYDQRGELACQNVDTPCDAPQAYLDFRLDYDPQLGWLITGIPSEQLITE